jgi:hypothetical protein
MFNIPLNRVQNENDNISGEISAEDLLEKWQQGLTLDFNALSYTKTESVHKEMLITFNKR